MFKFTIKLILKYKKNFFLMAIIYIIMNVLTVALPYLNGNYINILTNSIYVKSIYKFSFYLIFIGLISIVFSYSYSIINSKFLNKVAFKLQTDIIEHLQKIPLLEVSNYDMNYVLKRISDDSNIIINFILNNYIAFILKGALIVIMLIFLYKMNIFIFVTCIFIIPLYISFYILLKRPLYIKNIENKEQANKLFAKLFEKLNNIKEIKAQGTFNENRNDIWIKYNIYYKSFLGLTKLNYLYSSIDNMLSLLFQAAILIIGGISIIQGKLSIGLYITINAYYNIIINCVKYYFSLGNEYQNAKTSYDRIKRLYNINKENNGAFNLNHISCIQVQNLTFAYKSEAPIIKDVSHSFEKGNIYVLRGNNGTGKSTFLNIITGLIIGDYSGHIYYDNEDILNINMYELRKLNMSYIFQKYKVCNYLVKDIIDIKDIEIMLNDNLLNSLFNCDQFRIYDYLDSQMDSLSDGQKQKILVFMALIKKPEILVLDEPTSHLDINTSIILSNYLLENRHNRITIIATHDVILYEIANKVIISHQGYRLPAHFDTINSQE